MAAILSRERLRILALRLRERLWVKPLAIALISIAGAFASKLADGSALERIAPTITAESVETLLSIMASSMLVIATFAVASMVAAYSSAGSVATPRSFPLVIRDDVSQNALSTFLGAFIFSIVALTVMKNGYFGPAGLFCLFAMTALVFGMVIFTFVRWMDRIARLGRLGATVDKVEAATAAALRARRRAPTLACAPAPPEPERGQPLYASAVGYVQHIDVAELQLWAERAGARVVVAALPGTFAAPGRALAYLHAASGLATFDDPDEPAQAFVIGQDRLFDDDPRFGLVVLSEIAGRALSPAVNDPGTAIDVLGTLVRLFVDWSSPLDADEIAPAEHDRVLVPRISVDDMFDDAFTAIARDGAGVIEVSLRLQKALRALASVDDPAVRDAAVRHSRMALARSERALDLAEDLATARRAAAWSEPAADGAPARS